MLVWTGSPHPLAGPFLFLDRDGVVNTDSPEYVKGWGEFAFEPGALEALRRLRGRGVNVVVVSNQSALARGLITPETFWDMHHRMVAAVREAGGDILSAFYCPHGPHDACRCRKPAPGMLEAAAHLHDFPLAEATLIGDRATDMEAARAAGCRGVMISHEVFSESRGRPVYRSLADAAADLFG